MRSGEDTPNRSAKCIMKIFINLGYEGPNLSDADTSISGRTRASRSRRFRARGSDAGQSNGSRGSSRYALDDSSAGGGDSASVSQYDIDFRHNHRPRSRFRHEVHGRQEWEEDFGRNQSFSDRTGQRSLRAGSLDSTSDGKSELERRWLLHTNEADPDQYAQPSMSPGASSAYPASAPLTSYQQEMLQKLTTLVQTHLHHEAICCSLCHSKLNDLRFICMECGPLRYPSASPSDRPQEPTSTDSRPENGQDLEVEKQLGYELCEVCVEAAGLEHAQALGNPEKHAYIEAHKGLDPQGWRAVGKVSAPSIPAVYSLCPCSPA